MLDFVGKIRFWMVFFQKNLGGYQLSSSKWWKILDKTPLSPGSDLEKKHGHFQQRSTPWIWKVETHHSAALNWKLSKLFASWCLGLGSFFFPYPGHPPQM